MKILFCASECFPFFKSGGLGDVAYSLPRALVKKGLDVRVISPKYQDMPEEYKQKLELIDEFSVPVGWRNQYVGLLHTELDGVHFYFIDNEYYFKRGGAYGYYDDGERFAYLSRAMTEAAKHIPDFVPEIMHCNDWQTALIPMFLRHFYSSDPLLWNTKTVLTIHNLKFQGVFSPDVLTELLGVDMGYNSEDKMKYYDGVSYMKAGIVFSDRVTTVSKTYASEIQTEFFGEGLDGLLRKYSYKLSGIVNGIDYSVFSPSKDKEIFKKYSVKSIAGKAVNKQELQKMLGLEENLQRPLIGIISRLEKQKGLDLVARIFDELMGATDVQFVVLGTGNRGYEDMLKYFGAKYKGRVSANIMFSNDLSKKIYSGCDMLLMPSLFEPCGLSQLIALRYGTIPIVRETGGLKDTVIPYNEFEMTGNGFSFANFNAHEMLGVIRYALDIYSRPEHWKKIVKNAMNSDYSFDKSADEYISLYNGLCERKD